MIQNVQLQVGIYHEKFQHDKIKNGRPAATFDRKIFLCFAPKFIHIPISQIARMSSKLGKIRTETRSWCPKCAVSGRNIP